MYPYIFRLPVIYLSQAELEQETNGYFPDTQGSRCSRIKVHSPGVLRCAACSSEEKTSANAWAWISDSPFPPHSLQSNVSKAINRPHLDGLYQPFMVKIWGFALLTLLP